MSEKPTMREERVARAICRAAVLVAYPDAEERPKVLDNLVEFFSPKCMPEARAALAVVERELDADVRRLVIAARLACEAAHIATVEIDELDKAAEAFASRVAWEDEPETTDAGEER